MENDIANKILSEVGLIKAETFTVSKDVGHLKAEMSLVSKEVGHLKTGMSVISNEVGQLKTGMSVISKEISYLKAEMVTKSELHEVINAAIEESEHRLLTFMRDELATKKEVQALRGEFLARI